MQDEREDKLCSCKSKKSGELRGRGAGARVVQANLPEVTGLGNTEHLHKIQLRGMETAVDVVMAQIGY